MFVLHKADPVLIPDIPYAPPTPAGVISEYRPRSKPRELPEIKTTPEKRF